MKTRLVIWVKDGCQCIGCSPSGSDVWLGAVVGWLCPDHESIIYSISLALEKIIIQNLKYGLYWMCMLSHHLKVKNGKSNHHNLETLHVCVDVYTHTDTQYLVLGNLHSNIPNHLIEQAVLEYFVPETIFVAEESSVNKLLNSCSLHLNSRDFCLSVC